MLSQTGKLSGYDIQFTIHFWGVGALLGTAVWLIIYRSTLLQSQGDEYMHGHENIDYKRMEKKINRNICTGFGMGVASLVFFALGVISLSMSLDY